MMCGAAIDEVFPFDDPTFRQTVDVPQPAAEGRQREEFAERGPTKIIVVAIMVPDHAVPETIGRHAEFERHVETVL